MERILLEAWPVVMGGSGAVEYLLRDEFITDRAAGAVNGTAAEPGPGTRAAVDTNSKITIADGKLAFATGEAANDGYWLDLVTRAAGRHMVTHVNLTSTSPAAGWDSNQTTNIRDRLQLYTGGVLYINIDAATNLNVGSYTGTAFYIAAVMRAAGMYWFLKGGSFAKWTLIFVTPTGSANLYPGLQTVGTGGVFTWDYLRVPLNLWLPTPVCYDTFTRANGAIGSSETAGPEGQPVGAKPWSGSTWTVNTNVARNTPVTFGAEDIANGNMETGDPPTSWTAVASTLDSAADERTGGAGAASLSIVNAGAARGYAVQALDLPDGTWVRLTLYSKKVTSNPYWGIYESDDTEINTTGGTADTWTLRTLTARLKGAGCKVMLSNQSTTAGHESRYDDVSVMAMTLAELITVYEAGSASVVQSVDISNASFGPAGLVACCDSASNPANLILANVKGGDITLEKCVGGTWTRLIWTAVTQTVGGTLTLITSRVEGGLKVRMYYNEILIDAEQTINDAGIIENTLQGMLATDSAQGNQLNDYLCFARGDEGQYEAYLTKVSS